MNIVTNSCPPACDRPRVSNGSHVTHRTDNSVVTSWNNDRNQSRVGFQPHHGPVRILPTQNRVNRRISIYLSTRAGNLPRDRTSAEVGLDTNRLSGPFRSEITERVLSPDPILFIGYLKPNYYSEIQDGISMGKEDATNRVH